MMMMMVMMLMMVMVMMNLMIMMIMIMVMMLTNKPPHYFAFVCLDLRPIDVHCTGDYALVRTKGQKMVNVPFPICL